MYAQLLKNIDWVGFVDWNVRDFHSYDTARGATYNAYLVRDEKTALIDAVKAPYGDYLLENVAELCSLQSVDYVVCNHAEPDHSGALPQVMAAMPQATVVCDKKCAAALTQYYDTSKWRFEIVGNGSTLALGSRSLQFVETPMVHWPESMFTFCPEEGLLFSMDAFGQHYASSQRFDDESPMDVVMDEAKTYYANIVMPYGKPVAAVLEHASALDIRMIAPSHGIIWRSHLDKILAAYKDWCVCRPKPKVLVVYDTMWESTAAMAEAIYEGAIAPGVEVKLIHIRKSNLTRIAAEMIDAAAVAFGSATLNRDVMPAAAAVMSYLRGLRPAGKAAFAFGSFGWGRGAPEAIAKWIEELQWETLREPIRVQYRPTTEQLDECRLAGKTLAEKALAAAKP